MVVLRDAEWTADRAEAVSVAPCSSPRRPRTAVAFSRNEELGVTQTRMRPPSPRRSGHRTATPGRPRIRTQNPVRPRYGFGAKSRRSPVWPPTPTGKVAVGTMRDLRDRAGAKRRSLGNGRRGARGHADRGRQVYDRVIWVRPERIVVSCLGAREGACSPARRRPMQQARDRAAAYRR